MTQNPAPSISIGFETVPDLPKCKYVYRSVSVEEAHLKPSYNLRII